VAVAALPWAAGEMASRAARGAAWRRLKAPAEAALEAAGTYMRRVEATRRCRSQIRGWPSSPEEKNKGGEWRRPGKRGMGANEGGNGSRGVMEARRRANRRHGQPVGRENLQRNGAARTPARFGVEERVEGWFANTEKFRGLSVN
jgi:hypothetical protein